MKSRTAGKAVASRARPVARLKNGAAPYSMVDSDIPAGVLAMANAILLQNKRKQKNKKNKKRNTLGWGE